MSDFSIELKQLIKLGHPYLPFTGRELLTVDYLKSSVWNKALQKHLVTTDTSSIASTIPAIKGHMAIDNECRLSCWAPNYIEKTGVGITQAMHRVSGQSEFLECKETS